MFAEDISSAFESIDYTTIQRILDHVYEDDPDAVKMKTMIMSYLQRSSFVVDNDNKRLRIQKRYQNRTSPQGSILSPTLWRAYDSIFSHIYTRELNRFLEVDNRSLIECYTHVSYADDHVTVAALRIGRTWTGTEIDMRIKKAAILCRNILDAATRACGCSVIQKKSEILIDDKTLGKVGMDSWTTKNAKTEMVWLGHSLKISDGFLILTESRMRQRFQDVKNKLSNAFQYIKCEGVRMKVWKTYIAPIIEWFTPTLFLKPYHSLASSNEIEIFQQLTLSWAMKVSRNAPRDQMDQYAAERSVKYQVKAAAAKLTAHAPRTDAELKAGSTAEYASTMTLRGGKQKSAAVKEYPNAEAKD